MVVPVVTAVARTVVSKKAKYQAVSDRAKETMQERRDRGLERAPQAIGEKPSWILYMIVGVFALFKDLTDLVFGFIPGIGSAVALVFGLCFSAVIYLLLMAFDRSGGADNRKSAQLFVKRLLTLLGATVVDMVPLIGFLPVTTLSVMLLYWMAKRAWKKSAQ